MRLHSEDIRDERTRFYVPVKRVLRSELAENPLQLIGNREYQTVIHYLPVMTVLQPGGSLLLDFGRALHGGVRVNNVVTPGKIHPGCHPVDVHRGRHLRCGSVLLQFQGMNGCQPGSR